MKFVSTLVLALFALTQNNAVLAASHGGDEEHEHHSCACEAEELGFEIDCSDQAPMTAALEYLTSNGCASNCTSAGCAKNFYIAQSHHDYCPEAALPADLEDGIHDFEGTCEECEISRKYDASISNCTVAECTAGNTAYAALVDGNCLDNCTDACKDNYQTLIYVHDNCEENALSEDAEKAYHDFEEKCAAFNCNTGSPTDVLECKEDHHSDDEKESAAFGIMKSSLAAVAAVASLAIANMAL